MSIVVLTPLKRFIYNLVTMLRHQGNNVKLVGEEMFVSLSQ
jgi:hypothetical protein